MIHHIVLLCTLALVFLVALGAMQVQLMLALGTLIGNTNPPPPGCSRV